MEAGLTKQDFTKPWTRILERIIYEYTDRS